MENAQIPGGGGGGEGESHHINWECVLIGPICLALGIAAGVCIGVIYYKMMLNALSKSVRGKTAPSARRALSTSTASPAGTAPLVPDNPWPRIRRTGRRSPNGRHCHSNRHSWRWRSLQNHRLNRICRDPDWHYWGGESDASPPSGFTQRPRLSPVPPSCPSPYTEPCQVFPSRTVQDDSCAYATLTTARSATLLPNCGEAGLADQNSGSLYTRMYALHDGVGSGEEQETAFTDQHVAPTAPIASGEQSSSSKGDPSPEASWNAECSVPNERAACVVEGKVEPYEIPSKQKIEISDQSIPSIRYLPATAKPNFT